MGLLGTCTIVDLQIGYVRWNKVRIERSVFQETGAIKAM